MIAARCLGAAARCIELVSGFATSRVQFGTPIVENQAIQWMLADSATELAAAQALTDSGGERALLVDLASEIGVVFADPVPEAFDAVRANLDPSLEPANPADLWAAATIGSGPTTAASRRSLPTPASARSPYAIDFNVGSRLTDDYLDLAIRHAAATDKPFAVIGNISAGLDATSAATLRGAGVPVLHGAENGLLAFRHLLVHAERRSRTEASEVRCPTDLTGEHMTLLRGKRSLTERESSGLLEWFGCPVLPSKAVTREDELEAASQAIGFPLVLKTAVAGYP